MAFFSTRALLVLCVSIGIALHCAAAASYNVGGTTGWTVPSGSSYYNNWAANTTLKVGDTLVFTYTTNTHNVVQVSQANYNSCTTTGALATYTTGPTTINLTEAGSHYYICGVPGHCAAGQKVAITVSAATASPTPSPTPSSSPSPSTSPSPSPSPSASTPTATPTPSPSSSASPPVKSPVGSPSAGTPPPTPTTTPVVGSPPPGTPSSSVNPNTGLSPNGSPPPGASASDASYHSISPLTAWMGMFFAAAAGFFVL